jgi:probable rRNA maturation factor
MTQQSASPTPVAGERETGSSGPLQQSDDPEPATAGGVDPRLLVIDIVYDDADWSAFGDVEDAVFTAADAVANEPSLDLINVEAVVALSSDDEVGALNATYRGQAKPTNVLSFPAAAIAFDKAGGGRRNLGDIIVARETVLREAADQNVSPVHHLQHLVVHGLLHLLGYDHENDRDAELMEALEVRILARLGVSDPYGEALLELQENKPPR